MKKLLFYSDFSYALIVIKQAQKTLKPLIFNKISGLKIWPSGDFFVTLKIKKQIVMNKIKPLDQVCLMGGFTPNHVAKLQNNLNFKVQF